MNLIEPLNEPQLRRTGDGAAEKMLFDPAYGLRAHGQ